jgi:two-component system, chemotaxis family, response regulator WspF
MRIGIVNDLPIVRDLLRSVVQSVPRYEVIWMGNNGIEAVELARQTKPDLILMDLVMPRLDGAEATRQIMAECPCAILVVTGSVRRNMNMVYEAMGHGALDAVDTPTVDAHGQINGAAALLKKIETVGKLIGRSGGSGEHLLSIAATIPPVKGLSTLVLLGASTGGPKALADILSTFPAERNATLIVVQHVDAAFAPGLAQWLGGQTQLPVEPIAEGQRLEPGKVLVAVTNDHLVLTPERRLAYTHEPEEVSFRPSVDVFFSSVAAHWPDPGVAVLLTGMGRDGAAGLLKLRNAGWYTIAQDQETSVVWGMPKAAVELGAAKKVLPLDQIARAILEQVRRKASLSEKTG